MKTKTIVLTFAEAMHAHKRPDAHLLAYAARQGSGMDFDVRLLAFNSRAGLEAVAKKSGLRAVIPTQVPFGCAVHAFQSDSVAREARQSLVS